MRRCGSIAAGLISAARWVAAGTARTSLTTIGLLQRQDHVVVVDLGTGDVSPSVNCPMQVFWLPSSVAEAAKSAQTAGMVEIFINYLHRSDADLAITGVVRAISSNSSMFRLMPGVSAIATRCDRLVEPPDASTVVTALRNDCWSGCRGGFRSSPYRHYVCRWAVAICAAMTRIGRQDRDGADVREANASTALVSVGSAHRV